MELSQPLLTSRYLLHGACKTPTPQYFFTKLLSPTTCLQEDAAGNLPLHVILESADVDASYQEYVVTELLRVAPKASTLPNRRGQLPLHLALQNDCAWSIVRALLVQAPSSLHTRDPVTGSLPFVDAARDGLELNTTYQLLRAAPELLQIETKRSISSAEDEGQLRGGG